MALTHRAGRVCFLSRVSWLRYFLGTSTQGFALGRALVNTLNTVGVLMGQAVLRWFATSFARGGAAVMNEHTTRNGTSASAL